MINVVSNSLFNAGKKLEDGARNKHGRVRLSIVTPTLNAVRYIEQTANSVFNQSIANLEYLVVDGGSQDGTLERLAQLPGNVRVLAQHGRGIYAAMNEGITESGGEIIGIINAGDWYAEHALAKILQAFEDPLTDVVYGDVRFVEEEDRATAGRIMHGDHRLLWRRMSVPHPSVFVRRRCYERMGVFRTVYRVSGDYEWMLRAAKSGVNFYNLGEIIAFFRTGGISSQRFFLASRENFRIQRDYIGLRSAVQRFAIRTVISSLKTIRKKVVVGIVGEAAYGRLRAVWRGRWFASGGQD